MDRWYFPLKHVEQGDENGCAIACVAMIAGLSYERARHEMFPRRQDFIDDETLQCDDPMVSRCLRRVGFNVRLVDDHRRIKRPAIVSFTWQLDDPKLLSHSVVWDPWKRCFIDPSVSNGRVSPKEADEFIDLWVRTNGKSMIVTGRIRSSH